MTVNKKTLFLRCAVIATVVMIFSFSLQNEEASMQQSDSVAEFLQAGIDFVEDSIGMDVNIRKIGHFSEFALLGAELLLLYTFSGKRRSSELFNVFGAGLTVAVFDESIQLLVPGRSGQITDVLIDMSGFLSGALIAFGIYHLIRHIRKKYSVKGEK